MGCRGLRNNVEEPAQLLETIGAVLHDPAELNRGSTPHCLCSRPNHSAGRSMPVRSRPSIATTNARPAPLFYSLDAEGEINVNESRHQLG